MMTDKYELPDGYRTNKGGFFDDTKNKDEWQDDVYAFAGLLFAVLSIETFEEDMMVLDIGTGSGYKLIKHFGDTGAEMLGVDVPETVKWLSEKYRKFKKAYWIETDAPFETDFGYHDIVIMADVLEHLPEPDKMLGMIDQLRWSILVLSTPDRGARADAGLCGPMGPPVNGVHVREWTKDELVRFVKKHIRHDRMQWLRTEKLGQMIVMVRK